MATWHQQRASSRPGFRYYDMVKWTVLDNPPNNCASSMLFAAQSDAESYLARRIELGTGHYCLILPPGLRHTLNAAVTQYDRRREGKPGYNLYALGQYLARVDEVVTAVEAGVDLATALAGAFNDRLLTAVRKAVGLLPPKESK